ncbi:MAG: hypothetical protein H6581_19050 [Bacteroidia bacterium]|nr:hypothetical protein [Bacteroidia bacterium]
MKKISILFTLVLLISAALTGFTTIENVTSEEGGKWYNFTSSTGKFSIQFPAKPEISDTKTDEAHTYKANATVGESSYFVGFTVHTTPMVNPDDLAQVSLDAFNETLGGTIESSSEWKYKGETGRQAMIKMEAQGAQVDYKVIIIGQIQYQLIVISTSGDYDAKSAKKFFKSFKTTK